MTSFTSKNNQGNQPEIDWTNGEKEEINSGVVVFFFFVVFFFLPPLCVRLISVSVGRSPPSANFTHCLGSCFLLSVVTLSTWRQKINATCIVTRQATEQQGKMFCFVFFLPESSSSTECWPSRGRFAVGELTLGRPLLWSDCRHSVVCLLTCDGAGLQPCSTTLCFAARFRALYQAKVGQTCRLLFAYLSSLFMCARCVVGFFFFCFSTTVSFSCTSYFFVFFSSLSL